MIPEDIVNQVLDKVDIVEVVSGYVPLKRAGRNFKALCPFHHEKTPSFMVSPDKQIFHCFGCGVGGSVFNFLMKQERIEFPEAVRLMAEKVGVQVPSWSASAESRSESTKIYSANELACNFYHYMLVRMEHGKEARQYLKKRGIKDESIKKLKLGYAPQAWDMLLTHARNKGSSHEDLQKAGLVLPGKDGSFYDRFRHRIIFPISDHKGKVVGFGGRVLDETLPKYINSPETPVYNKGQHLYGLNAAVEHIKEKDFVIVVEGYIDFLTPYQSGIGNIVASLGTALTVEQVRLLKRFTRNIIVVFDPDTAGESASLKGLDLLVQEGMNTKIVSLPQGYDPDSVIREKGVDSFLKEVNGALDFFYYKLKVLRAKYKGAGVASKAEIAAEMLETIAKISNAVVKTEYMKKLSDEIGVREDALWVELKKAKRDRPSIDYEIELSVEKPAKSLDMAHKMLLGLLLEESSLIPKAKDAFKTLDIKEPHFNAILNRIYDFWDEKQSINIARLINSVKEEAYCSIISESCAAIQSVSDRQKCFQDCLNSIRQARFKDRLKDLQGKIRQAQASQDEKMLSELISEYNRLIKQK